METTEVGSGPVLVESGPGDVIEEFTRENDKSGETSCIVGLTRTPFTLRWGQSYFRSGTRIRMFQTTISTC